MRRILIQLSRWPFSPWWEAFHTARIMLRPNQCLHSQLSSQWNPSDSPAQLQGVILRYSLSQEFIVVLRSQSTSLSLCSANNTDGLIEYFHESLSIDGHIPPQLQSKMNALRSNVRDNTKDYLIASMASHSFHSP